jgi:hypothetical protein
VKIRIHSRLKPFFLETHILFHGRRHYDLSEMRSQSSD